VYGGGGADVLRGFAGNDVLFVSDANFALVDGGTGTDVLWMDKLGGFTLDLTNIAGVRIRDIEMIDMNEGFQSYSLIVTKQSLLDLSSTTDILKVMGDSADTVKAAGFTSAADKFEDGITFKVYKNGTAELWAQQGVVVDITTPPPPAAVVPQAFSWAEHAVLAA
jgi:hypothetical protein